MPDSCANCKWLVPHGPQVPAGHGVGTCHRYPPFGVPKEAGSYDNRSPDVYDVDYVCGEWVKKK